MHIQSLSREQKEHLKKLSMQLGILDILNESSNDALGNTSSILENYITVDRDLIHEKEKVKTLSKRSEPVLILGETGTGKEILAKALHGDRKGKFVAVNMTSLPEQLAESELFGHIIGAFTDAKHSRVGKMSYAEHGTLFMDEIGDLSIGIQAKILRAIQNKSIVKVGSNEEEPINCRFVFSTHQDLSSMVEQGTFRRDLYYRISTFIIRTKPLRSRSQDVYEILDAVLDKEGKIDEGTREEWSERPLYGNVRELEQLALRYLVFGKEQ